MKSWRCWVEFGRSRKDCNEDYVPDAEMVDVGECEWAFVKK